MQCFLFCQVSTMFIYSEMLYLIFHTTQKASCYRVILHMGEHMAECIIISKYCLTPKKAILSLQIEWTQHQKEADSITLKYMAYLSSAKNTIGNQPGK